MLDPKLKTLICTAEQKSFTSAAKLLSLTQPAVSHHISQLEEEFGVEEMSEDDVAGIRTVGDLLKYLQERLEDL